ncbi:MAG: cupin domain-containing protein [Ignavibacteriales bacterium]
MRPVLAAVAALSFAATAALAHDAPKDAYSWGPAPAVFPTGAQMAVLSGDPGSAGLFTVRLRFPPGYAIPAHNHPTDELVTVIDGKLSLGMGDKLDKSGATTLKQGGYVVAPAKMNHYAFSDSGAVVQITAEGPFGLTYVNPADDPTRTP